MADAYESGGRDRERRSHIGGHKRSAAGEDRVHRIRYPGNGNPQQKQPPENPDRFTRVRAVESPAGSSGRPRMPP